MDNIITGLYRLAHPPKLARRFFKNGLDVISDQVIADHFSRELAARNALDTFTKLGLLADPSRKERFKDLIRSDSFGFRLTTAMFFNLILLKQGIPPIVLPKVDTLKRAEIPTALARNLLNGDNLYDNIKANDLIKDYRPSAKIDIIAGAAKRASELTLAVYLLYISIEEDKKESEEARKKGDEFAKRTQEQLDNMAKEISVDSDELLKGYIESYQKKYGKDPSKEEIENIKKVLDLFLKDDPLEGLDFEPLEQP